METLLTKAGCRCLVALNGPDVIAMAVSDIRFHVIFMDVNMPIGEFLFFASAFALPNTILTIDSLQFLETPCRVFSNLHILLTKTHSLWP